MGCKVRARDIGTEEKAAHAYGNKLLGEPSGHSEQSELTQTPFSKP